MKLQLNRPIVFFDIEATGLNTATDRIVELCFIKVHPNGNEESQTLRFNPGIHISEEATAVNGIKDEDVADCPKFKEKAEELAAMFKDCDIAGFNSNHFDIPLLVEEFIRAGVNFDISGCRFVDVQTALADTRATYEVLQSQLDRYTDELHNDIGFLAEFSRRNNNVDLAGRIVLNEQKEPVINFGKYRGRAVREVLQRDPGYFAWIMQGDFTQNTKQTFMRLKLQMGL